MVGLEKTFYSVSEDVGVVEVCAIVYSPTINCPIEFSFDVNISTSDGSAGNTWELHVSYITVLCVATRHPNLVSFAFYAIPIFHIII